MITMEEAERLKALFLRWWTLTETECTEYMRLCNKLYDLKEKMQK